jgi:hypothetical protein
MDRHFTQKGDNEQEGGATSRDAEDKLELEFRVRMLFVSPSILAMTKSG